MNLSTQNIPWNYFSNMKEVTAALGSLIILKTLRPAIVPASLVAYFYAKVKQCGVAITQFSIGCP